MAARKLAGMRKRRVNRVPSPDSGGSQPMLLHEYRDKRRYTAEQVRQEVEKALPEKTPYDELTELDELISLRQGRLRNVREELDRAEDCLKEAYEQRAEKAEQIRQTLRKTP